MKRHTKRNARYGLDIKGITHHEEADTLAQIGNLLAGHSGRAFVFDRQSNTWLLEGNVHEVRDALGALIALCTEPMHRNPDEA